MKEVAEEDEEDKIEPLLQVRDKTRTLRESLLPIRVESWSPSWVAI